MTGRMHPKITASHLRRDAYLYVRQATVQHRVESTRRQYALRERAVALGWPRERVQVIDSDLGRSAASAADRDGYQRVVDEVGRGRAGIVLAVDVSRLTRNACDWNRLLTLCARTDTLIATEDGVFSPDDLNDWLRCGRKPTVAEAELGEVPS